MQTHACEPGKVSTVKLVKHDKVKSESAAEVHTKRLKMLFVH